MALRLSILVHWLLRNRGLNIHGHVHCPPKPQLWGSVLPVSLEILTYLCSRNQYIGCFVFLTIICSVIISYHLIFIPFAFYNSLMCDLEGKWYKIIVIIHLLLLLNRIKVALLIANFILFFLELTSCKHVS